MNRTFRLTRLVATGAFVALILIALLGLSCSWFSEASAGRTYTITILSTNDIHSNLFPYEEKGPSGRVAEFGGLARIATIVNESRAEEPNSLLLDAGDIFYPNSLSKWRGKPEIGAMDLMGYDCVEIGNHEFDLGDAPLGEVIDQAGFPFLCANIDVSQSPPLAGKVKSHVIINVGGHSVGVFGLVTPYLRMISSPSEQVVIETDLVKTAGEMVAYLKPRTDLVVALTHLGSKQDVQLAKSVGGIDVIVGGHSHEVLERPIEVENPGGAKTLITQTGCYGRYVGKLRLVLSDEGRQTFDWSLISVDSAIEANERVAAYLEGFHSEDGGQLGVIDADLNLTGASVCTQEATIGTLVCSAIAEKFPAASVVLVNSGAIRGGFQPAGPITRTRLDEILPFHNKVVLVWMTGRELITVFERSVAALPGPSGGLLQLVGAEIKVDLRKQALVIDDKGSIVKPGERVTEVLLAGEPLEADRGYLVATINYLARGGDGYLELARAAKHVETEQSVNDLFADYITKHTPLHPERARCYVVLNQD